MATSGSIGQLSTVRDLIAGALRVIGVADNHQDAASYDDAMQHLQWMLKSMQSDGINMWRIDEESVLWLAGNQVQTLTPNIINIQDARVVISSTFERTMGRFEYGDYVVLPNKDAIGAPTIYTFQKRTGDAQMYVWPVPSVDTTLHLTVARVIEDVTDINQTVDLPQEWEETVVYNLADRLLDVFSVSESQPNVAARVTRRAAALYQKLMDMDRPGSVYFQPWQRQL